MKKTIKVGLIGYGMAGRVFHAPILTCVEGLQLVKIRETRKENIDIENKRYQEAQNVSDSKEIYSIILKNDKLTISLRTDKHHFETFEKLMAL